MDAFLLSDKLCPRGPSNAVGGAVLPGKVLRHRRAFAATMSLCNGIWGHKGFHTPQTIIEGAVPLCCEIVDHLQGHLGFFGPKSEKVGGGRQKVRKKSKTGLKNLKKKNWKNC